jgi:hypothetical protein
MDPSKARIDQLLDSICLPDPLPPSLRLRISEHRARAKRQLLKVFVREAEALLQVTKWEHLTRVSFTREERMTSVQDYFDQEELKLA